MTGVQTCALPIFNGSSRVVIGNPSNMMVSNNYTLCAWVKVLSHGNYRFFWGAGTLAAEALGYGIFSDATTWLAQHRTSGATAYTALAAHGSNTNWVHLAIVRNNTLITLYTNGLAAATTTGALYAVPDEPFSIGQRSSDGTWAFGLTGMIDEAMMFATPLTSYQILQVYQWRP